MPKLAERLTDVKIKNAKPKEKSYKLAASRGLYLLVKTALSLSPLVFARPSELRTARWVD